MPPPQFHMGRYTVKETVRSVKPVLKSSLGSLPRLPTNFVHVVVFDYRSSGSLHCVFATQNLRSF